MNPNELLTTAAFMKLQSGEPMSTTDFERILSVLDRVPLKIEVPDQGQIMGLQGKFKALLQERFLK